MNMKLVFAGLLAALALLFVIQNTTVVDIRFLFWTLSMSRALLLLFLLAIGMVVGWLLRGMAERRR